MCNQPLFKRKALGTVCLTFILVTAQAEQPNQHSTNSTMLSASRQEIKIGALLPLTGVGATFGEELRAALEKSTLDFNGKNQNLSLKLIVQDTATDPDMALTAISDLNVNEKVHLITGIPASADLERVKPYADQHEIILFSCCSTSADPILKQKGDNLFRMLPDDENQSGIAARMIYEDSIKVVVPAARNDSWGRGMISAFAPAYIHLGGGLEKPVFIPVNGSDKKQIAESLELNLQNALAKHSASEIAVLLLEYSAGVPDFMETAATTTPLVEKVKWLGVGIYPDIQGRKTAANFAENVDYTTFLPAPNRNSNDFKQVRQYLLTQLQREPSTYVYAAYDTIQLLALSILRMQNKDDTKQLQKLIPEVSRYHEGLMGLSELDAFGDLKTGKLELWQFINNHWVRKPNL